MFYYVIEFIMVDLDVLVRLILEVVVRVVVEVFGVNGVSIN